VQDLTIDPFEYTNKHSHIWRGKDVVVWFTQKLDNSFSVSAFYDFGDVKRRFFLEIKNVGARVEFKNDEISEEKFEEILAEIKEVEKILGQ